MKKTGLQALGGLVEGFEGVQCEACHGIGSPHAQDPDHVRIASKEIDEKTCRRCHDGDNSPHFNFETYRPKILGPGHGMPMPEPTAAP